MDFTGSNLSLKNILGGVKGTRENSKITYILIKKASQHSNGPHIAVQHQNKCLQSMKRHRRNMNPLHIRSPHLLFLALSDIAGVIYITQRQLEFHIYITYNHDMASCITNTCVYIWPTCPGFGHIWSFHPISEFSWDCFPFPHLLPPPSSLVLQCLPSVSLPLTFSPTTLSSPPPPPLLSSFSQSSSQTS